MKLEGWSTSSGRVQGRPFYRLYADGKALSEADMVSLAASLLGEVEHRRRESARKKAMR